MGCGDAQLGPAGARRLFLEEGGQRLSPPPAAVPGKGRDLPAPSFSQGEAEARCKPAVTHAWHSGAPCPGWLEAGTASLQGWRARLCGTWGRRDRQLSRDSPAPHRPVSAYSGHVSSSDTGSPSAAQQPATLPQHPCQMDLARPAPMSDGSCSPAPCWHCGHHHALSQGPTHPVPVSAAWGPSNWVGWVLSRQPQNPAGSTTVHQGQARQRPRCHAGMVPFISRGQRKEEEPCALHAKAALWLPAGEQGRRQTKQQLPRLLAMRVPKPVSPGTPRHSAGWSHMPQRDKRCCRQSPASSPWPCSQQVLGNLEEGQDCAQPGSSSAGWWPGTTTSLARRAGRR